MYAEYYGYCGIHPGQLTEAEFGSLLTAASDLADVITQGRAASAGGYKKKRLELAVCAVIDEMHTQQSVRSDTGARVSSVTNDGYTEVYGSVLADSATTDHDALVRIMRAYLSGTGLVSAL